MKSMKLMKLSVQCVIISEKYARTIRQFLIYWLVHDDGWFKKRNLIILRARTFTAIATI